MRYLASLAVLLVPFLALAQGPDDRDMLLVEPTTLPDGQPLTVNGAVLESCTASVAAHGTVTEQVFPAADPNNPGASHTIDLTGFEGEVCVRATCLRRMGTTVSDPSEEAGPLCRTFRVRVPGVPGLQE